MSEDRTPSDERESPRGPEGPGNPGGRGDGDLQEMLEGPEVETLLARFRMPREVAGEILDELTLALLAKEDRIRDPRRWLLRTLRLRCVAWWRERRRRLWRVADRGLRASLEAAGEGGEAERDALRQEVEHLLAELSPRCREALRRRYGLGEKEAGEEAVLECVGALLRRVRLRG